MKKLLLIASIATFVLSTNAQTEQGNWVITGGSSFSFASTKATTEVDGQELDGELKATNFTINPGVGYFVIDDLAVGLDLAFSSLKNDDGTDDFTTSSFSVIPSGTYFFEAGENLKPFIGAGVGLVSTSSGDEDSQKSSGLAIRGRGGLALFLNETVSINFSIEYLNTSQKNKEFDEFKVKNSGIGAGVGFSIFL